MEQSVCCYVPRGARPVGLLPVLNKSKCGRKGNNVPASSTGANNKRTDGLADLGEYPWHVSKCLRRSFFHILFHHDGIYQGQTDDHIPGQVKHSTH